MEQTKTNLYTIQESFLSLSYARSSQYHHFVHPVYPIAGSLSKLYLLSVIKAC